MKGLMEKQKSEGKQRKHHISLEALQKHQHRASAERTARQARKWKTTGIRITCSKAANAFEDKESGRSSPSYSKGFQGGEKRSRKGTKTIHKDGGEERGGDCKDRP